MGKWSFSKSVTVKRAQSARNTKSNRDAVPVADTQNVKCRDGNSPPNPTVKPHGPGSDGGGGGSGLKIKGQHARIELGAEGDVSLMRSGDGRLTIDGNTQLSGTLNVEGLIIDGVPLAKYISDIIKARSIA